MKQFKKVLLGILVLSSIMLCSGSYQFFDAENGIIPVTNPEWNIVSAAEGKGSFVEEITVDKDFNSSKYEGVPYWVFHNDGKLYNIYIPNLEDYATSIEPIFPEGFSIEEYYNSFPENCYEENTLNDNDEGGEASSKDLQGLPQRNIIGTDGRNQITSVDSYPYNATAYLVVNYSDGAIGNGTGFFIDSDVVITAGHGLYNSSHGWASSITVYPGGTGACFGGTSTTNYTVPPEWSNYQDFSHDYGVILLNGGLGNGTYGLGAPSDANLLNQNVILYGYKDNGTLWYSTGTVNGVYIRQFLHNADSEGGASGGPIVRSNSQFTVCGIHSGAYDSNNNAAVRITSSLIQYFNFFVNLS